jgi:hypothetical protein
MPERVTAPAFSVFPLLGYGMRAVGPRAQPRHRTAYTSFRGDTSTPAYSTIFSTPIGVANSRGTWPGTHVIQRPDSTQIPVRPTRSNRDGVCHHASPVPCFAHYFRMLAVGGEARAAPCRREPLRLCSTCTARLQRASRSTVRQPPPHAMPATRALTMFSRKHACTHTQPHWQTGNLLAECSLCGSQPRVLKRGRTSSCSHVQQRSSARSPTAKRVLQVNTRSQPCWRGERDNTAQTCFFA